jgi:predicted outer membrane protein
MDARTDRRRVRVSGGERLVFAGMVRQRRGTRAARLRWTVSALLGFVAGTLALPATAVAAPAVPAQLSAADLALFDGVRLAGLWEMPAGQMAAERGSSQRVRQVGAEIAAQHAELDQLAVDAANKVGHQLPTKPTDTQQGWLDEMRTASSDREFDQIFVDRLRAAHGKIFPVIGAVRSGTRNEVARGLAQEANQFVLNHLSLLESTGLVRYDTLPGAVLPADQPPADSLDEAALARTATGSGFSPTAIWGVLLIALVIGGVFTYRMFRPR